MAETFTHTLRMTAPPDDVDTVHRLLGSVWADVPSVPVEDQFRFETALIELASNVIRYAGAGKGVSCTLTIDNFEDRIEAMLTDTGEPGDMQLVGRSMPDDLAESGRGILLIQALVDELSYDRHNGHNYWRIMRKLKR